jgi:cell division protein FtsA
MPDKSELAVGLDLGSSSTRCLILRTEGGRVRYAGHSEAPSDGWSKGRLADQQAVTASVRAAVHEAEVQARVSVDTLVLGIGGSSVEGCNARGI